MTDKMRLELPWLTTHAPLAKNLPTFRQAHIAASSGSFLSLSSLSLSKRTPTSPRPPHPTPGPLTLRQAQGVASSEFCPSSVSQRAKDRLVCNSLCNLLRTTVFHLPAASPCRGLSPHSNVRPTLTEGAIPTYTLPGDARDSCAGENTLCRLRFRRATRSTGGGKKGATATWPAPSSMFGTGGRKT